MCRTIKQLLTIFCIVTFVCSCIYLFVFYIAGNLYSGDELFGYRIAISVLGFVFYSILLYKAIDSGLESITKGVENGIKSAAR